MLKIMKIQANRNVNFLRQGFIYLTQKKISKEEKMSSGIIRSAIAPSKTALPPQELLDDLCRCQMGLVGKFQSTFPLILSQSVIEISWKVSVFISFLQFLHRPFSVFWLFSPIGSSFLFHKSCEGMMC